DAVRHISLGDDVRNLDAPSGLQYAIGFGKNLILVRGQIDHAVGNDDVDRAALGRQALDLAEPELRVGESAGRRIDASLFDHGFGHIDADHAPARPDLARRQKYINAGAAAEIEHRHARLERQYPGRVATA